MGRSEKGQEGNEKTVETARRELSFVNEQKGETREEDVQFDYWTKTSSWKVDAGWVGGG